MYIIIGGIILIAILVLITVIYHSKCQFVVIKISEAENNIDILLDKKLDLLRKCIPLIRKSLKEKDFMEELDDFSKDGMSSLELHNYLRKNYNKIFKTMDENEKLYKRKNLMKILDELNDNELQLSASIKFYNDNVNINNEIISKFPMNMIRFLFGYKQKELYENEKIEEFEILKEK